MARAARVTRRVFEETMVKWEEEKKRENASQKAEPVNECKRVGLLVLERIKAREVDGCHSLLLYLIPSPFLFRHESGAPLPMCGSCQETPWKDCRQD